MSPILEIRGLVTSFDGFKAVGGVDLTINEGELRFLIGPNGAGKTTLIDTVTGLVKATAGSVRFAGKEMLGLKEYEVVREGIGRTFQTPTVFERLSVVENIDLAATFRRPLSSLLRRRRGVDDAVAAALQDVGLVEFADSCPTDSASGSRSGCCWFRTPGSSCSTSPWRG